MLKWQYLCISASEGVMSSRIPAGNRHALRLRNKGSIYPAWGQSAGKCQGEMRSLRCRGSTAPVNSVSPRRTKEGRRIRRKSPAERTAWQKRWPLLRDAAAPKFQCRRSHGITNPTACSSLLPGFFPSSSLTRLKGAPSWSRTHHSPGPRRGWMEMESGSRGTKWRHPAQAPMW